MKLARLVEFSFGSDSAVLAEVVNRMNDNDSLQALWEQGRIFFNHFVRLSGPSTHASLRRAFHRGAALFPPSAFKGCDIIVPVYFPVTDTIAISYYRSKNRRNDVKSPAL